jgi:hypothetical protein
LSSTSKQNRLTPLAAAGVGSRSASWKLTPEELIAGPVLSFLHLKLNAMVSLCFYLSAVCSEKVVRDCRDGGAVINALVSLSVVKDNNKKVLVGLVDSDFQTELRVLPGISSLTSLFSQFSEKEDTKLRKHASL